MLRSSACQVICEVADVFSTQSGKLYKYQSREEEKRNGPNMAEPKALTTTSGPEEVKQEGDNGTPVKNAISLLVVKKTKVSGRVGLKMWSMPNHM